MLRCFEGDERIVQALRLPVGPGVAPAGGVPRDAVDELMVSEVLGALVRIAAPRAGSPNQRQPDGMIVRLVRSILAICQDGGAELAAHVRQVDPLVRRHFELLGLRAGPLDRADVPVVRGHGAGSRQRESRLQIRLSGVPVDYVGGLHTLARIARRKANGLHKHGARGFTRNLDRHAGRPAFHHSHARRTSYVGLGRGLLLVPIHVPGWPLLRIVIGDRQARRSGQAITSAPVPRSSAADASARAWSMSPMTIRAPCSANAFAMASPIPWAPPVTTAAFPSSKPMCAPSRVRPRST